MSEGNPYESPQTVDPPLGASAAVSPDDRMWAMFAHLAGLLGYALVFGHIAGPLVIYLVYKEKSKFVAFHALQSLFFQIAMSVLGIAMFILGFVICITWFVNIALALFTLIYVILAAVKTYQGEMFEYVVVGPYARQQVGI